MALASPWRALTATVGVGSAERMNQKLRGDLARADLIRWTRGTREAMSGPRHVSAERQEKGGKLLRRQGVTCLAVAPMATEDKEYDYDSPKMRSLVAFLERDLIHLFDEQGIDRSMYNEQVEFRDPISNYNTLTGYLFNIQLLRTILTPKFELHSVKQTGPTEITTRWTMTMYFLLLPWRPELIFTGISVMTVNQDTGKFSKHVDIWDSIENNEFFSFEAVTDLFKQLGISKIPNLEMPGYKVLKRTSKYQVRQYEQFLVAETAVDQMTGTKGFKEVTGYLFGKNSKSEKMKMTTPVFSEKVKSAYRLQVVLPLQSQTPSAPSPLSDEVCIRTVEKGYAAVIRFNGEAIQTTIEEKERVLRDSLTKDGLQGKEAILLARYNDPGSTWPFLRRNELIIWLEQFAMETT